MNSLEAFVLIGGRSSRMGRDKALVKIGGITLAQRAVNTIADAFPDIKISLVARDENQFSTDDLPKDIPIIFDIHKDLGAYSALHAALTNSESEWVFILACDMPFVSVDLLKFMADLIDGVFDAIVNVSIDGRIQPLCAFYRRASFLPTIEQEILRGGKLPPLAKLLESAKTRKITPNDIKHLHCSENFLININSPDDIHKISGDLGDF